MKKLLTLFLCAAFSGLCLADGAIDLDSEAPAQSAAPKSDIGYDDAIVLGIVEGFTEYLPVSSTGHLILANAFLKLENEEPLLDGNGEVIYDKNFEPYTLKRAVDAYAIVIQFGAILAVAFMYWSYIVKMFFGLLGRNPEGLRLARNLLVAFLPAVVVGLLIHKTIEANLFGVGPVIIALAVGALLMLIVQKLYGRRNRSTSYFPRMEDMSLKQSLVVGILQCVAMWPGTSRSMMTILGGYIAGLKPADAAKFSFLLGLITLSAASFFKVYNDGEAILKGISVGPLALGIFVSFVCAAVSIKWMVGFLSKHGLAPFAWYRLIIAGVLSAMLYFNML